LSIFFKYFVDLPGGAKWAVQTSYFWYGFEALCVNEFENKSYGTQTLSSMGFETTNKLPDIGILAGVFVGLRIIAYLLLRFVHKEKR
jgi:hypothetical protein